MCFHSKRLISPHPGTQRAINQLRSERWRAAIKGRRQRLEVLHGMEVDYSWAGSRSDPFFGAGPGCQEQVLKNAGEWMCMT